MPQKNEIVLTLGAPKTVTPAVVITTATVERLVDLPNQQIVRAFIKELPQPLVLWAGADYVTIGNWTQDQANARILALLA